MNAKWPRRGRKLDREKLRQLRLQHGLSQGGLAAKVRRDLKTVKRAEGGEPIDFSTIKAIADVFEVAPVDLLATDDTAIDQFYEAMRYGRHAEAMKEFSEGAKLRLHARSEDLLSSIGMAPTRPGPSGAGLPEPGQVEGVVEIGTVLGAMCSVATVIDAEEEAREPLADGRFLSRGRVVQRITPTQKAVEYTFFLLFKLGSSGRIDELEMSFDTDTVAEGFR